MARSNRQDDKCRPDLRGGGFAGIPVCLIESAAYKDLSLWARAVLVELAGRMRGFNNGRIGLSVADICTALGNSNRGKASRAIAELIDHGIVDVSADAMWKQRKAREYRLTYVSTARGPATNEYLSWTPTPEKIRGNAPLPDRPKLVTHRDQSPPLAGNASLPRLLQHQRKSAKIAELAPSVSGNGVLPPYTMPSSLAECGAETSTIEPPQMRRADRGADVLQFPGTCSSTCDRCGEGFNQVGTRVTRRFCSETCRSLASEGKAEGACQQCGGTVTVTRDTGAIKRFCSERCRKKAESSRARERAKMRARA